MMITNNPNNSTSPPSPTPNDELSSIEEHSLQKQYSFFEIDENEDSSTAQENKKQITNLMKMLHKKGLLSPNSFKDFVLLDAIPGPRGRVFKAVEKEEHVKHLNPDGSYYGGKCLALKKTDFFLQDPEVGQRQLLSGFFHKNSIQVEKVFFEEDKERLRHSIIIVMPWINHTLMSWMLKRNNNRGKIADITENKRRFEEVRRMLRSILKGIEAIHLEDHLQLNIEPENIFIKEYINELNEAIVEPDEYMPFLISEPMISDSTINDKQFMAPELLLEKKILSSKADIFSFGMILYKIFIDENHGSENCRNLDSHPFCQIRAENVKQRIEILFPKDKDTISESMIEDITKIIQISLEDNPELRPQASNLLQEHEFFKLSQKDLSKIQDFEIENTLEYGLKLLEGKNGYPKDLKKAREIFEKLSNSFNHIPSTFFLGFMVYWGLGGYVSQNLGKEMMRQSTTQLMSHFESHCDDALGFSEFAIGHIHFSGHGVPEDNSKALEFFQKSSNKGNSFAQRWLGEMNEYENGVEKNSSFAFDFYKKSALQGNSIAQDDLGFAFEHGFGIKQDYNEAFKWYKLSADQRYPSGQINTGSLYDDGNGVLKDKEKAAYYYKMAAEMGDPDAQCKLAEKLEIGEGIAKDLEAAIQFYEKAAEQDDEDAIEALKRLKE